MLLKNCKLFGWKNNKTYTISLFPLKQLQNIKMSHCFHLFEKVESQKKGSWCCENWTKWKEFLKDHILINHT